MKQFYNTSCTKNIILNFHSKMKMTIYTEIYEI